MEKSKIKEKSTILFCCMIILALLLLLPIFLQSHYKRLAEIHIVQNTVEGFWNYLLETAPENRDIDKIMDTIYFANHNERIDTIRKTHYKEELLLNRFEIQDMKKLTDGLYLIQFQQETPDEIQDSIYYYAAYIKNNWKLVFGKQNIPNIYLDAVNHKGLILPVNPIPKDTEVFPMV